MTDINPSGDNNEDALICQSEVSFASDDTSLGNWFLHPSQMSTDDDDRILHMVNPNGIPDRGWSRNRDIDPEGHRLVRLRRLTATAEEGVFTCNIPGDNSGPISVEIFYPSESGNRKQPFVLLLTLIGCRYSFFIVAIEKSCVYLLHIFIISALYSTQ